MKIINVSFTYIIVQIFLCSPVLAAGKSSFSDSPLNLESPAQLYQIEDNAFHLTNTTEDLLVDFNWLIDAGTEIIEIEGEYKVKRTTIDASYFKNIGGFVFGAEYRTMDQNLVEQELEDYYTKTLTAPSISYSILGFLSIGVTYDTHKIDVCDDCYAFSLQGYNKEFSELSYGVTLMGSNWELGASVTPNQNQDIYVELDKVGYNVAPRTLAHARFAVAGLEIGASQKIYANTVIDKYDPKLTKDHSVSKAYVSYQNFYLKLVDEGERYSGDAFGAGAWTDIYTNYLAIQSQFIGYEGEIEALGLDLYIDFELGSSVGEGQSSYRIDSYDMKRSSTYMKTGLGILF